MGCSNPHPHGQIWATETVPDLPAREDQQQKAYLRDKGQNLLCAYLALELRLKERIVCQNEHFVSLVPFWAVWPYETLTLPRKQRSHIGQLSSAESLAFAEIIRQTTGKYDRLFNSPFPYSAGIHQAPTDGQEHPAWQMHMHFYPPLLRSATVRKFMVGFEMLANPQRDLTAEFCAGQLRTL